MPWVVRDGRCSIAVVAVSLFAAESWQGNDSNRLLEGVILAEVFSGVVFFFSSRRRHTRSDRDWSSDVCSSDLQDFPAQSASTERKTVAGKLLGNAAGAFLGRAAHDVAHERARNPAPVDPAVLE